MKESSATPRTGPIQADEAVALEFVAAGVREALGALAVHCGSNESDGTVRFGAAAPVGGGKPASIDLADYPDLEMAVLGGKVSSAEGLEALFEVSGESRVLPLTSRGTTIGLAIAVMGPGRPLPDDRVLALAGAKAGSILAAVRDAGDLAHRTSGMQDSATLLGSLVEESSDAIAITDLDGRIVTWNRAAERLYGWSEDEVRGEVMPYLPKDMRRRATQDIRAIAASGRSMARQVSAARRSGAQLAVDIRVIPVRDMDGIPSGVMSVARHVSTEEHGRCCANDFAQTISSEVSAPLTALIGYAQLLGRPEIVDDPSRRTRTLRALEKHGSALADLLEEAVMVSRLREGVNALDREKVDIASLLADVVSRFEESRKGQRVVVDFVPGSGTAHLDRRRVERAIRAMLLAATCERDRTGEVAISLNSQKGFAFVRIEVRCPGGMPAGAGDSADSGNTASLGLYLAGLVAEAHGGSFERGVLPAKGIRWYRLRFPVSADAG